MRKVKMNDLYKQLAGFFIRLVPSPAVSQLLSLHATIPFFEKTQNLDP